MKYFLSILMVALIISLAPASFTQAQSGLVERTKGRILLQVEERGEAWYVNPDRGERFYLRNGNTAYEALRAFGLGITNADLMHIPIGVEEHFQSGDTDGDGLADQLEGALWTDPLNADSDDDGYSDGIEIKSGYNPRGSGRVFVDSTLVSRLGGKILLQVESRGEAWYLNPVDGKRYYMKDGESAYNVMRYLGLGISNNDLSGIPVGYNENKVTIQFIDQNYTVNDSVDYATIDFEIANNLQTDIYYESFTCGNPVQSKMVDPDERSSSYSQCTFLYATEDTPATLGAGAILRTQDWGERSKLTVNGAGKHYLEFTYYLQKNEYLQRSNATTAISHVVEVSQIDSSVDAVVEACRKNGGDNGLVECLYVAAKNSIDDLPLAIELCDEIDKMGHGFKGCYSGVALMLRKAGRDNEVGNVCNNYQDGDQLNECLSIGT